MTLAADGFAASILWRFLGGILAMKLHRLAWAAIAVLFFVHNASANEFVSGGSSGGWLVHHDSFGSAGHLRVRYYGGTWGNSSGGSTRAWGSSGGNLLRSTSYEFGSSGGQVNYYPGPIRRFFHRMHESPFQTHGSSGGGSHGSSGGSSGGTVQPRASIGDETASISESGFTTPTVGLESDSYEVTLESEVPVEAKEEKAADDSNPVDVPALEPSEASLTVSVPKNAKVVVNGHLTKSKGEVRHFRSVDLDAGEVYTYRVQISYSLDGEERNDEAVIRLKAGTQHQLDFRTNLVSEKSSEDDQESEEVDYSNTIVRVHVPQGSVVSLGGNSTSGTGALRTFKTESLRVGQVWQDYVIRVESEIDGEFVTQEKTVSIIGGTESDYHFDFTARKLAAR